MREALALQQSRRFAEAEKIYRGALSLAPELPDALHMLGVVRYERGDHDEAAQLILHALDLTNWQYPTYRHNLGLALARCHRAQAEEDRAVGRRRVDRWLRTHLSPAPPTQPRIAVIVPCHNHERYVQRALESVFEQTYREVELVVIDDGSTDATAAAARQTLARSPFPYRFLTRENRGAAATINEGVALSTSPYVNILNSDDWFREERLAAMVRDVVARGAEWGFSGIECVDEVGRPIDLARDERARALADLARSATTQRETTGFAFLTHNAAISSGNIFFSRALYDRIGGFRELRFNHDWDFCLRAVRVAEPEFCPATTYAYRLHGSNTIYEAAKGGGAREADTVLNEYIQWGMSDHVDDYPIAPSLRDWGMYFICVLLGGGIASLLDVGLLRELARPEADRPTTAETSYAYRRAHAPRRTSLRGR
jgi:glycosyltransferase involved in cell wall biosynthesis